ncbi:XTP/dITP diphosphatase [Nicoliella spurrieriana]|uniref:dITP/XTP pyrophosphatase n=1 Tax=Nicoliella spurrieriana TaxID=2925830 RepID=A0A976RRY1_9LACO|nr:XTP/dITP diphosphatase [Nicoliella spurrieriana]UQS86780.1 XTP/dITP diphosphatase [Nicoliella spurrieriana]
MTDLIIATNNPNKAREFREMLEPHGFNVKTLADFPEVGSINENGATFEQNATIKARAVVDATGLAALADDSGLQVAALNGAPGVHSARYAGDHDDLANNQKLLANLVGQNDRSAIFRTCLVLLKPSGAKLVVNGDIHGEILDAPRGTSGFGYDPLFYVPKFKLTMGEMTDEQKNSISHRGRATRQLLAKIDEWWNQTK